MNTIQLPCPVCRTPIEQGMEHCPGCSRKVTDEFAMQLIAHARSVTRRMGATGAAASPFNLAAGQQNAPPPIPQTSTRRARPMPATNRGSMAHHAGSEAHGKVRRAIGALVHQPLARVPENTLKFGVGVMLSAFGVFWTGEGLGIEWPGGDVALAVFAVWFLLAGLGAAAAARKIAGVTA